MSDSLKPVILWAEDCLEEKSLISHAFADVTDRFRLVEVSSGVEVLYYLREHSAPAMIVLDINMPDLDGRETIKVLKSRVEYNPIPVLFYSATNNPVDKMVSKMLGAPIVFKCVDDGACRQAVEQILSRLASPGMC